MTAPSVKAVLILDSQDASRVHVKYYSNDLRTDSAAQAKFERNLFTKTRNSNARMEAEVLLLDNTIAVYKTGIDVQFYVIGDAEENELVLVSVR